MVDPRRSTHGASAHAPACDRALTTASNGDHVVDGGRTNGRRMRRNRGEALAADSIRGSRPRNSRQVTRSGENARRCIKQPAARQARRHDVARGPAHWRLPCSDPPFIITVPSLAAPSLVFSSLLLCCLSHLSLDNFSRPPVDKLNRAPNPFPLP